MKKLFGFLVAVLLVFSLCGGVFSGDVYADPPGLLESLEEEKKEAEKNAPDYVFSEKDKGKNEMNKELCEYYAAKDGAMDPDGTLREAAGCNAIGNVMGAGLQLAQVAIGVAGILAALIIVIGGQRYVSAGGDASKLMQAKNMILYAVIGLIVCALAFSIVTFVSQSLGEGSNTGTDGPTSGVITIA